MYKNPFGEGPQRRGTFLLYGTFTRLVVERLVKERLVMERLVMEHLVMERLLIKHLLTRRFFVYQSL